MSIFTRNRRVPAFDFTLSELCAEVDERGQQRQRQIERLEAEVERLHEEAKQTGVVRAQLAQTVQLLGTELCESRVEFRDVRRACDALMETALDDRPT